MITQWLQRDYTLPLSAKDVACETIFCTDHLQYLLWHGHSPGPEHFWLLLSGQTVVALCNVLMWGATSLLSEIWFPSSERATSSAFGGGISAQLGVMVGYALSPTIVDRSDTNEICGNGTHTPPRDTLHYWEWNESIFNRLFYYLLGQAVFSLATFLLTLVGALVQMSLASFPVFPPMYYSLGTRPLHV